MQFSNNDNKKTELKILLEKIKNEEMNNINDKRRKKEINSKCGNVKEDYKYKNYNYKAELGRNPENTSVLKKELSTLQSTIDNLEKKLCII